METIKTFYGEAREEEAVALSQSIKNAYAYSWVWAGIDNGKPYARVEVMTHAEAQAKGWRE